MSGRPVEHHAVLDSTNTRAKALVEAGAAAAGLLVLADEQTAGRGQRGATWHTVPGRSLALSLVVPRPEVERPGRLPLLAALATAHALEGAGSPPVAIKWPNDLYVADRKVGGLLLETASDPEGRPFLVAGLGVNLSLRPGDLPAELGERAGDCGLPVDRPTREALGSAFAAGFEEALAQLGTAADRARGEEYRRRSWLVGRRVRLAVQGRPEDVELADVTPDGDLVLADGRRLRGEHCRILPEGPADA